MLKQSRKELKMAGLTRVVSGNKPVLNFAGKTIEGVRGGSFGPMTATDVYQINNQNARDNIKSAMFRNGYEQVDHEYERMILKFKRGNDIVKFTLESYGDHYFQTYWWTLNK